VNKRGRTANKFIPYVGLWGQYEIPNHLKVEYVLASIDLRNDKDKLRDILAVREVFDVGTLPFEHLLQRDLDDARIADEIVNEYLAGPESVSPIFFPPITVVILPKEDGKVGTAYPPMTTRTGSNEQGDYEERVAEETFSIKIFTDGGKKTQDCELSVNPSKSYLLAIDGQHRLMAVKACVLGTKDVPDIYQPLYASIKPAQLEMVNLPVCFLYFPDLDGSGKVKGPNLVATSRRIFLDVNRNARKPVKSREILLDDYDLVNIFVRETFGLIKSNTGPLKLYHTEYDTQSGTKMTRPMAITDVYNLEEVIKHLLKAGTTTCKSLERARYEDNDDFMRQELAIIDKIPIKFCTEHGIKRQEIKSDNLPPAVSKKIAEDCFSPFWGKAIVKVLESFYPYKIHNESVSRLKSKVDSGTISTEEKLAAAMLFAGQGLWWICNEKARKDGAASQVGKASKRASEWVEQFREERAKKYLQKSRVSKEDIQRTNDLYDLYNSKAFQVGLFMAIAYVKHTQAKAMEIEDVPQLAEEFVNAVNESFENNKSVRERLFHKDDSESIRYLYKPSKLVKGDWPVMRAVLLSLL